MDVFFVLSGFVISYTISDAKVTPKYIGKFALRRSIRLDPPYWLTILFTYIFLRLTSGLITSQNDSFPEWLAVLFNMVYLDNIFGVPSIVKVGWTLQYEVQFYLIYVLLFGLMQQLTRFSLGKFSRLFIFAPLALYSFALATKLTTFTHQGLFIDAWYMFFLGVIVSWAISGQIKKYWAYLYIVVAIVSIFILWDLRTVVSTATALSILIIGLTGHLEDSLSWKGVQFLGRISYSLYLLHPLIGHRILGLGLRYYGVVPSPSASIFLFIIASSASIFAAYLMYRLVERPSMKLSKLIVLREPTELLVSEAQIIAKTQTA